MWATVPSLIKQIILGYANNKICNLCSLLNFWKVLGEKTNVFLLWKVNDTGSACLCLLWAVMSGEDGTHCETVAGKREANLRASSHSLPFRAWIHVMRARLWVSFKTSALERTRLPDVDKKVAFSYLFVESKPEQNPRARISIFAAFMFLSESNWILCLQHKNQNVSLYYSSFFQMAFKLIFVPVSSCWNLSLEVSVGFHLACSVSDDNFRDRNNILCLIVIINWCFSCSISDIF